MRPEVVRLDAMPRRKFVKDLDHALTPHAGPVRQGAVEVHEHDTHGHASITRPGDSVRKGRRPRYQARLDDMGARSKAHDTSLNPGADDVTVDEAISPRRTESSRGVGRPPGLGAVGIVTCEAQP
jgi:hypothetical protein